MKNIVINIVKFLVVIVLVISSFVLGNHYGHVQMETMKTLCIVGFVSVIYCFVVGEISRNNSQMDKLWSIMPIIYAWIVVYKGDFRPRLIIMAVLITVWGTRLTYNFAKKGAYSIKFWSGEEDYRWAILRNHKLLNTKFRWALFDFFFISFYQNALVLAICFPMVSCMSSNEKLGIMDGVAAFLTLFFILYETVADAEQMRFQTAKWKMLKEGKALNELPIPLNKGFNTSGLFAISRHPNYFAEQSIWVSIYLFCIGAGVTNYIFFDGSMFGCMMLILLFAGSAAFGESISSKKYEEYKEYQKKVNMFIPGKRYI